MDRLFRSASRIRAGRFEVEQHEVGGRALAQAAGLEPEQLGRRHGQLREQLEQAERAVVDQLERDRQQRLEADRAELGLGERQALAVLVLGPVVARDRVDRAVGETAITACRSASARSGGETLAKVR